jgi:nudix-type nucleoside diphosphatase (YffH/AdpP family)
MNERSRVTFIGDPVVCYKGWTSLRLYTMQVGDAPPFTRVVEDHGTAVAVLPYDPLRKMALLVSMPRAPVRISQDDDVLEAPAGVIESDDPRACARREALEEAGVQLTDIDIVMKAWSMPALSSERATLCLAAYSAADRIEAGGGLAEENENITVRELSLGELWQQLKAGDLPDMKTALLLYALHERRPDLFS